MADDVPTGDLFPTSPRIVFDRAPLAQVLAQVLFPTILKIEQTPADFQDRIRSSFPVYEAQPNFPFPAGTNLQLPVEALNILRGQGGISHRFLTADRNATITLAQGGLTLTVAKYSRWEPFFDLFKLPLAALVDVYQPSFYTRVALRYSNVIDRIKLGLSLDTPWSDLIRAEVLGLLAIDSFRSKAQFSQSQILLKLPSSKGRVTFQHGLQQPAGHTHPVYLLDFDFFEDQQTGVGDAESILGQYHVLAGDAFRWCIRPELFGRLGPNDGGNVGQ